MLAISIMYYAILYLGYSIESDFHDHQKMTKKVCHLCGKKDKKIFQTFVRHPKNQIGGSQTQCQAKKVVH